MKQIDIIIADDHRIFREGVRALLEREAQFNVIGEAASAEELMAMLTEKQPCVVLMDIDMGESNGIDATEQIRKVYPEVEVLALSMHSESNYIVRMLDVGAKGYILKNTGREEMAAAIRTVAAGDSYFSSKVSTQLLAHLNQRNKKPKTEVPLTPRELEILRLIASEYSNPEIAEKLFISVRTVDTHRRNLLEKLNLKNTAGLVKYAIKQGLLDDQAE